MADWISKLTAWRQIHSPEGGGGGLLSLFSPGQRDAEILREVRGREHRGRQFEGVKQACKVLLIALLQSKRKREVGEVGETM